MVVSSNRRRLASKQEKKQSELMCGKDQYPNYRDFGRTTFEGSHKFYASSTATKDILAQEDSSGRGRGGKKSTFPKMLYEMVDNAEDQGYTDVIAWMPHGRSFVIKDKHRFTDEILPRHFGSQNSFASFQRQLNVYGFLRMTKAGPDRKSYYHELFLRGRKDLITIIPRKRKTTARVRRSLDPMTEPNLYLFPPCLPGGLDVFHSHDHHDADVPISVSITTATIHAPADQSPPSFNSCGHSCHGRGEPEQVPESIMSNEEEAEEEEEEEETSCTSSSIDLEVFTGSPYHSTSLTSADAQWWHSQFIVNAAMENVRRRVTPLNNTSIICFEVQHSYDILHEDAAADIHGADVGDMTMPPFWEDVEF